MAKNREVRLEGEFRRALSEIFLTDLKDPRVSAMLSVMRVEITPDLKYAKAYVSIYDTPERVDSTMEALERAEGFIRAKLNDKIKKPHNYIYSYKSENKNNHKRDYSTADIGHWRNHHIYNGGFRLFYAVDLH